MKKFDQYIQSLSRMFPETRQEIIPCYERFEAETKLHFPIHCDREPILHVHYLRGKFRTTFYLLNRKLCGYYGITPCDPTVRDFELESHGTLRENPGFLPHIRKSLNWLKRQNENTMEVPEDRKRDAMDEILYSLSPDAVQYDYEKHYESEGNHNQRVTFGAYRGLKAELSARYLRKSGWNVEFKISETGSGHITFSLHKNFSDETKFQIIREINQALLRIYVPEKTVNLKKNKRKICRFINDLLQQTGAEVVDIQHDGTPTERYCPERFRIRLAPRFQLEPVLEILYYRKSWLVRYYILNRKIAGHFGIGSDDICANIDRDSAWFPAEENKLIEHIQKSLSWLAGQTGNDAEIPEERKTDAMTDLLSRLDPAVLAHGWWRAGSLHAGNWQQSCELKQYNGRDGNIEMCFGKEHWNLYFEIIEHTPEGGWIEDDQRKFVLHCDYTPENAVQTAEHINKAMHWMYEQKNTPRGK